VLNVSKVSHSIKNVFSKLQDDISKQIFKNRLLYCLDGDKNHLFNMLRELGMSIDNPDRSVILYGCGGIANDVAHIMRKIGADIKCFCDDNKQKSSCCGFPVISPDELYEKYNDNCVVISTLGYRDKVYQKLTDNGFRKENIIIPVMTPQYFGLDFLQPKNREIYVDAGCFDGETLVQFNNWCDGKYDKIYGLEPDTMNFEVSRNAAKNMVNTVLVNKGAWNNSGTLSFSSDTNGGGGEPLLR